MTLDHVPGAVKLSFDFVSAGIVVGTIAQLLPHLAAILTIVWTLIRIFETDTVKGFMRRGSQQIVPAIDVAAAIEAEKHDG